MLFERNLVAATPSPAGQTGARKERRPRWAGLMQGQNTALLRAAFFGVAAMADALAIVCAALASGFTHHLIYYSDPGPVDSHFLVGCIIAALFVVPNIMRNDYAMSSYFKFTGHLGRSVTLWNLAFLSALILAFLTKTTTDVSRGTMIYFYVSGFVCVGAVRSLLVQAIETRARTGAISSRRVFLVGHEAELRRFSEQYKPWTLGMRIVAAAVLRDEDNIDDDLALAAASARMLRPDDVFILAPWSQKETIDACVNAFMRVPASIHLGPERILDRFADVQFERNGPIASLSLVRRPLTTFEVVLKRAFDIVASSVALVLLSPLFAFVALAIKLDSKGPVIFRQRRYGFNQQPFRIYKFRSMSTMDDGRDIVQARKGDARITRVGGVLRRLNIDELPQLVNVLRGEMSLVGPRPHALAHDQHFERSIALYARRHNVKPGITGWAQVNGLRGETNTPDLMRKRVEHDLYYIDNWSPGLDFRILFLTVFSRKAYRNAL